MCWRLVGLLIGLSWLCAPLHAAVALGAELEWITVADDGRRFVCPPSGRPFVPWGLNYDHDELRARLIEDYWEKEWSTVEADFREMKRLGANVVRIHLQFARFIEAPGRPNGRSLDRLLLPKFLVPLRRNLLLPLELEIDRACGG